MWKEITFLEFVEYRKHYNVQVKAGLLYGGGGYGEWGKNEYNSRIRWESTQDGHKWFKFTH